jgi:hypothetical protein
VRGTALAAAGGEERLAAAALRSHGRVPAADHAGVRVALDRTSCRSLTMDSMAWKKRRTSDVKCRALASAVRMNRLVARPVEQETPRHGC